MNDPHSTQTPRLWGDEPQILQLPRVRLPAEDRGDFYRGTHKPRAPNLPEPRRQPVRRPPKQARNPRDRKLARDVFIGAAGGLALGAVVFGIGTLIS